MSSSPLKVEASAKAQEPSMEEILASIRKIISDDDAKPVAASRAAAAEPEQPAEAGEPAPQGQDDIDALLADFDAANDQESVLELTEEMVAADESRVEADLDFVDALPAAEVEPEPEAAFVPEPMAAERAEPRFVPPSPPQSEAPRFEERLLSSATDSAISSAFGSLTHTILSHNARTLDDLVQDMLRPMLKAWLDDNLPSLVERLVRAEIERVSRGGR
jgi:cell pole-organizing protein PopZ